MMISCLEENRRGHRCLAQALDEAAARTVLLCQRPVDFTDSSRVLIMSISTFDKNNKHKKANKLCSCGCRHRCRDF